MRKSFLFLSFILLLCTEIVFSQEILVGLDHNPVLKGMSKYKTKSIKTEKEPLQIPFFDDFSVRRIYPDENLWENQYAYVNQTYPILPPTVGVVTLDALDAHGNLYPHASILPFGADTLTSRKIRLDSLFTPVPQKLSPEDSIYLSFYYQPGGGYGNKLNRTGGTPDIQDSLVLEFYDPDAAEWIHVWSTKGFELDILYERTGYFFDFVMIPIVNEALFAKDFQFRFRNYCSLSEESYSRSSNTAQWHLDYIYLNKGRRWAVHDSTIRDMTFVNPAKSILKKYEAMPSNQYRKQELVDNFQNTMANLYKDILPCWYRYRIYENNNQIAFVDKGNDNIRTFFPDFKYNNYPPHIDPELKKDALPDAIARGHNIYTIEHIISEAQVADDHPQNDTIRFQQVFWDYYAYDDGSAENGYGIETGSPSKSPKIAYRLRLNEPDTLTAVSIYFNRTYNDGNANVEFKITIWDDHDNSPKNKIYQDEKFKKPKFLNLNEPDRYVLDKPVIVSGTIYFGIEQKNSEYINIGFDRNRESAPYLYYDAGTGWTVSYLKGSPMMRSYFGYEAALWVEVPEVLQKELFTCKIYPNPTAKYINIMLPENVPPQDIEVKIFDIKGKEVYKNSYKNNISIEHLRKGVYVVQVYNNKKINTFTGKLIITD